LVSALVHALLFLFLLRTFGLVKILPIQKKVTPVRIVPSPKIYPPGPGGEGMGIEETIVGPGGVGRGSSRRVGSPPGGQGPASGGVPGQPGGVSRTRLLPEDQLPPAPLIGELRLSRTAGEPRLGVPELVLGPRQSGLPGVDTRKYAPPSDFDFRGYIYSRSPSSGTRPPGSSAGTGSLGGSGGGGGGGSPAARSYDITPWAQAAVDLVQKHWAVSQLKDLGTGLSVRITVIIEKSGELSSLAVLSSSDIPLFDQAALHAIEQSIPLPRLPDDFPDEKLELLLVFELHG